MGEVCKTFVSVRDDNPCGAGSLFCPLNCRYHPDRAFAYHTRVVEIKGYPLTTRQTPCTLELSYPLAFHRYVQGNILVFEYGRGLVPRPLFVRGGGWDGLQSLSMGPHQ